MYEIRTIVYRLYLPKTVVILRLYFLCTMMQYILLKLHNYSELDHILNDMLFTLAKVDFSPAGHKRVVLSHSSPSKICTLAIEF